MSTGTVAHAMIGDHLARGEEGVPKAARVLRCLGVVVVVGALFTAAASWGWNTGALPAPPLVFMLLAMMLAAGAFLCDVSNTPRARFVAWAGANGVVAMTAFLWSTGSDIALQEVNTRVLSSLLLVACCTLLVDPAARHLARRCIVLSAVGAVSLHVWEITHPLAFSMALGRSAGFHVNPNIAGAALVASMLLGLPAVPARLRELFLLWCGVGVLATLSRGALLCWGISVGLLAMMRAVRASRLALVGASAGFIGASLVAALLASGELGYIGGGAERFVRQRLSIGSKNELGSDVSASSRAQLAMHALDMFGERPITGHGVGATVEWRAPESTHNIYVRQLAEYGLAGAWLAPALVLLAIGATRPTQTSAEHDPDRIIQRSTRVFACFVALWGMFSHNVLDDAFILIGVALIAGGVSVARDAGPSESKAEVPV